MVFLQALMIWTLVICPYNDTIYQSLIKIRCINYHVIAHVISHVFKVRTKRKQKHKFLSDVQDYILMEISGTLSSIGGYDCSFINTPHDRFVCKICHLPSRDPYLSVCCGHVFCKSCLDNAKRIGLSNLS